MSNGESFDAVVLPHLDAAHRLARWLMRDEHDAEDLVQEASLRAFRSFRTFTGGNGKAWFLRIVRNTCYGWRGSGFAASTDPFDEEQHSRALPGSDPETLLLHTDDVRLIEHGLHRPVSLYRAEDGIHWFCHAILPELNGLSPSERLAIHRVIRTWGTCI